MPRIAFVTWNGGGNLGPAQAIARELRRRGHRAVGYAISSYLLSERCSQRGE